MPNTHRSISAGTTVKSYHGASAPSKYAFIGLNFPKVDNKSVMLRALRESNQKRIMKHTRVVSLKTECVVMRKGIKFWKCPNKSCQKVVRRLTAAHVGASATEMIKKTMQQNPNSTFLSLDKKIMKLHETTPFAICCDDCNSDVENKTFKSIKDQY